MEATMDNQPCLLERRKHPWADTQEIDQEETFRKDEKKGKRTIG